MSAPTISTSTLSMSGHDSSRCMATEYGSSPVEQAIDRIRNLGLRSRVAVHIGSTDRTMASNW